MPLDVTIFGPAGFPLRGPSGPDSMSYLASLGLQAMEYQAVRKVGIGAKSARRLGAAALENGIVLSLHAPYAINFSSEDRKKITASKKRLLKSAIAAQRMGAIHVTFHPGYYGNRSMDEVYAMQLEAISDVEKSMERLGIRVEIGPETTGKESQFGSLLEVLRIAKEIPGVRPTIDFGHMHVRSPDSRITSARDYQRILSLIENELGAARMNGLPIHFSEVEPTKSGIGERRHHRLGSDFGPRFDWLAGVIAENGYRFVIISESPLLELDSIEMKRILERKIASMPTGSRMSHGI